MGRIDFAQDENYAVHAARKAGAPAMAFADTSNFHSALLGSEPLPRSNCQADSPRTKGVNDNYPNLALLVIDRKPRTHRATGGQTQPRLRRTTGAPAAPSRST